MSIKYRVVFVKLEKQNPQDTTTWKWHAKFSYTSLSGIGFIPRPQDIRTYQAEPSDYFRGVTADACPPRNTATVPDLEDYHPYLDAPTPTPTPKPTATPTPTPGPLSLTVSTQRSDICAGGWDQSYNNGAGGYYYLSKETNQWFERPRKVNSTDPHIVTLTATVKGGKGNMSGRTVTFHCDMPGPDPAQDVSGTTDAKGIAKVAIISGDELSRDTDDQGKQLFNEPVPIDATCKVENESASKRISLNVLAPSIQWQYKNEQGNYVTWDGSIIGLYSDERPHIPLRAVLTFNNKTVVGHHISWGLDAVYNKAGAEVPPSDSTYKTYGQLSGTVSTTDASGGATATFHSGYNLGQLVFAIEDSSTYSRDGSDSSALTQNTSLQAEAAPTSPPKTRRAKKSKKSALAFNYYDYPGNVATTIAVYDANGDARATVGGKKNKAYPAPGGEEDGELIDETLLEVRDALQAFRISSEWSSGRRNPRDGYIPSLQSDIHDIPSLNDPSLYNYYWWLSQVIGQDPASAGTHFADFSADKGGKTYLFGAAFDIVLWQTPIFKKYGNKARPEFQPFVRKLRKKGIVAWHRWAGEYNPSSSYTAANPASDENEIHCIDPLMPSIKSALSAQVAGFQRGWANRTESSGYLIDFKIDLTKGGEKDAVVARAAKRSKMLARYKSAPWSNFKDGPIGPRGGL